MNELPPDCAARVRAGDLQAFEALYRGMHAPLLAYAARHIGDTARAEELIQDLFLGGGCAAGGDGGCCGVAFRKHRRAARCAARA